MREDWAVDPDYQLLWPHALFSKEALAVLHRHGPRDDRLILVFEEAFYGDAPAQALEAGGRVLLGMEPLESADPWTVTEPPTPLSTFAELTDKMAVQKFVSDAKDLPRFSTPRPYWGAAASEAGARQFDAAGLRSAWARAAEQYVAKGYIAKFAAPVCVDSRTDEAPVDERLSSALEERLGWADLWPIHDIEDWDDGAFYGAVEVFHDLVARPRHRWWHPYGSCGWHYSEFSISTGQELYRLRVNQLFERSDTRLSMASSGEDRGRLVSATDDSRGVLLDRVLSSSADMEPKQHAIALFRSRGATLEDKRSACIALSGLLEQSRTTLRQELLSKDEGALFQIVNAFNIRHRNANQRSDYDPAYLDWLFWWLLATVDLIDQLDARQSYNRRQIP